MNKNEFWSALEYRIGTELAGFGDPSLRSLWCDGVYGEYLADAPGRRALVGTAFIGTNGQTKMKLLMHLPPDLGPTESIDTIDWSKLLPNDNLTGWLAIDLAKKIIEIDLSKAERIDPRET